MVVHHPPWTLIPKLLEGELWIYGLGFNTWAVMGWRAAPMDGSPRLVSHREMEQARVCPEFIGICLDVL